MKTLRIGLVGYGSGGRHFHAPFIDAAAGTELTGIVARAPATIERVRADYPEIAIHGSLTELIASGEADAVTITTPPETRRELVLEAIEAGLHVVADKPFAPGAAEARELDSAAAQRGVTLGAYQNRRHDSDFRTLSTVIESGRLGDVWRIHSNMDLDEPGYIEAGPTGGVLRDLGSHLVDQMLHLLGPARSIDAHVDEVHMPEGLTDASFAIAIHHECGTTSYVSASKLNRLHERTLRAYGSAGGYVCRSIDAQERALRSGRRPADDPDGWGYEPESHWGTLSTEEGAERVPAEQGRYHDYYEAFATAVATGGDAPATARDAVATLTVLDAARESARAGHSIAL